MRGLYYVYLFERFICETWAGSEAEARRNAWWKYVKEGNPLEVRWFDPIDFEAVQIR